MKKLPFMLILLIVSLIIVVVNTVSVYNAVLNNLTKNTNFYDQIFLSEVADNAVVQLEKSIKIAEIIGFQLNNVDFNKPERYEEFINGIIKKDSFIDGICILSPVERIFHGSNSNEANPLSKVDYSGSRFKTYLNEQNSNIFQDISTYSDAGTLVVRVNTKYRKDKNVIFLISFNVSKMIQIYKYHHNENFNISIITSNGNVLASSNNSYKKIDINLINKDYKFKFNFSNSDYYVISTNNTSAVENFVFPDVLKIIFIGSNLILFFIFVFLLVIILLDKFIINKLKKTADVLSFELSELDKNVKVREVAESDFFNELAIKREKLRERMKNEN